MGTRTAAYRDGRVIFFRCVMDEALAKFIADAIIVVRKPPPIAPRLLSSDSSHMPGQYNFAQCACQHRLHEPTLPDMVSL